MNLLSAISSSFDRSHFSEMKSRKTLLLPMCLSPIAEMCWDRIGLHSPQIPKLMLLFVEWDESRTGSR